MFATPYGRHSGGQVGGFKSQPAKREISFRGHPSTVDLTRAERFWIQTRIEKIPHDARTEQERNLLAKVAL